MTDTESTRVFHCDMDSARMDVYLTQATKTSRNKVQQAIKDGCVRVNDVVTRRVSRRLQAGDLLSVRMPEVKPIMLVPEPLPLDIVYEDDSLIVINKAAGMPVHPGVGRTSGTLVNALLHYVGTVPRQNDDKIDGLSSGQDTLAGLIRPGIVHRLDMDTSGLMVVAKNDSVHRAIQSQFQARTIDRKYAGIVWGIPEPRFGEINCAIGRDPRARTRMAVRARGKSAITLYKTIRAFAHASLVEFRLQTGRTHQIRVHAQHIGHSIMGDRVYQGDAIRSGPVTSRRKAFYRNVFNELQRQALHARSLGFIHPESGKKVKWERTWPPDMAWVLDKLERDPV